MTKKRLPALYRRSSDKAGTLAGGSGVVEAPLPPKKQRGGK